MSPLDKMWLSFYGLGFMAISIGLILLSRHSSWFISYLTARRRVRALS